MKAAILRDGAMVVDEIDAPEPGPGQVLVETIACGICGSDLHTVGHAHDLVAAAHASGVASFASGFDPDADVVMGHELAVRVVDLGPGVEGLAVGGEFAAMPVVQTAEGSAVIGYSNRYPGGYAELLVTSPQSLVPIPNGLDPALAALTEPMAVGLHAVKQSSLTRGQAALVVGAGPVGQAIVAALAAIGHEPILAADFSPTRRAVAAAMGAHVVVDPAAESMFDVWRASHSDEPPVVFEAVGVPGMIDATMAEAPPHSEIVVAGVCIPPDHFRPTIGIFKHLRLTFVLGWTPDEFAASLDNLAEGRIDGTRLVTGEVGIDGVPQAFADLADPETHVKVLVRPNR